MIINNEILNAVIHCKRKAYLKKTQTLPSIKTELETAVNLLKEKQKSIIEPNKSHSKMQKRI